MVLRLDVASSSTQSLKPENFNLKDFLEMYTWKLLSLRGSLTLLVMVSSVITFIHMTAQFLSPTQHVHKCFTSPSPSPGIRYKDSTGRFDNSRKYLIHDFVYVGRAWSQLSTTQHVCLATHSSIDQLFRLVELSQSWRGLVSISVFVPGYHYHIAVRFIQVLTQCYESVEKNVSIHFVYPSHLPPTSTSKMNKWTPSCFKWKKYLNELFKDATQNNYDVLYPQNHLRNVARKGCQTNFVYATDVDLVPSLSLATQLDVFLQQPTCEKCAFVIPTYEIKEDVDLPYNKLSLLKLIKKNRAQSYRVKAFKLNQFLTNVSAWEKIPEDVEMRAAYNISYEFHYEPFYVAPDDVPAHDERFVGYGYTRNTQVYEMNSAGYTFVVLNNAFAMHRGFKTEKEKSASRKTETKANKMEFIQFKKEIEVRYQEKRPSVIETRLSEIETHLSEIKTRIFGNEIGLSENEISPSEIETGPSEAETGPSKPETGPSEVETRPSKPETGPSDPETGPSESETGPSEPETGPSEPETGPSEPETGPSEPETGPSEPETGPSEPETGPSEPLTGPSEIERYPSEAKTLLSEIKRLHNQEKPIEAII